MENIEIKKVLPSDLVPLQEISRKTFFHAFSEVNTAGNMAKYLEEELSLKKLAIELEKKDSEFYFAILDNDIIGYLKLNFGQSQTELQDDKALEIERIYVLKDFQGKKVGQLLYDKAMQIACHAGINYIWLGVWEKNERAIKFYKRNGFVEFDQHIFKLGEDEQTDIMMKRIL